MWFNRSFCENTWYYFCSFQMKSVELFIKVVYLNGSTNFNGVFLAKFFHIDSVEIAEVFAATYVFQSDKSVLIVIGIAVLKANVLFICKVKCCFCQQVCM